MSIPIRLPILNRPSSHDVPGIPPPPDASADEGEILMQIGDLAKESGKTVRAIHLYEELELLRPAARSKGRYRLYGKDALVRIRWIGKLQDMGFSLTDIQSLVRDWDDQRSAARTMAKRSSGGLIWRVPTFCQGALATTSRTTSRSSA